MGENVNFNLPSLVYLQLNRNAEWQGAPTPFQHQFNIPQNLMVSGFEHYQNGTKNDIFYGERNNINSTNTSDSSSISTSTTSEQQSSRVYRPDKYRNEVDKKECFNPLSMTDGLSYPQMLQFPSHQNYLTPANNILPIFTAEEANRFGKNNNFGHKQHRHKSKQKKQKNKSRNEFIGNQDRMNLPWLQIEQQQIHDIYSSQTSQYYPMLQLQQGWRYPPTPNIHYTPTCYSLPPPMTVFDNPYSAASIPFFHHKFKHHTSSESTNSFRAEFNNSINNYNVDKKRSVTNSESSIQRTSLKRKRRCANEPRKPKPPRYAWNFYFKEKYQELRARGGKDMFHVQNAFVKSCDTIGAQWKKETEKDREKYYEMAKNDKVRYENDIKEYNADMDLFRNGKFAAKNENEASKYVAPSGCPSSNSNAITSNVSDKNSVSQAV